MNWLKRWLTPCRSGSASRRRTALRVEALENRLTPASFVAAGNQLVLLLNTANESVGIVSNGDSYALTLNGTTWAGSNSANVTGNGEPTLNVTAAGLAVFDFIQLSDAATGTSVAFNDSSANAYTDAFTVVLDDAPGAVTFNGSSSFTGNAGLTVGTTRNVTLNAGASLTTEDGAVMLSANRQETPTAGSFIGIDVNGASLTTTGTGDITLQGRGGNVNDDNYGVQLRSGAVVGSTATGMDAGTIALDGVGGNGATFNHGVQLRDSDTRIISAAGAIHITGQGMGTAVANRGVVILDGAAVSSASATITIQGTGGGGLGGSSGVLLDTGHVQSATGAIEITGEGGAGAQTVNHNGHEGILVFDGATIHTTSGSIELHGTGGNRHSQNFGVALRDADTRVSAENGSIEIVGSGRGVGGANIGVLIDFEAAVASTGSATITIDGTGSQTGTANNFGVSIDDGFVRSVTGGIEILGQASGTNVGIRLNIARAIEVTGSANATLSADNMRIAADNPSDGTHTIDAPNGTITLKTSSGLIGINLGGADSASELGLTNDELGLIRAGTLQIGATQTSAIVVTSPITLLAATGTVLTSADNITFNSSFDTAGTLTLDPNGTGAVRPLTVGTDATASTVSFASNLAIVIDGTTVDTEYTQLNVSGTVDLSRTELVLSGTHTPAVNETFVIVSATNHVGNFTGLPTGALIGLNGRALRISYTSTQVVLTGVEIPTSLVVDNTSDVSDGNFGAGQLSLREAIEMANLVSDANTITFAASVFGTAQTITLSGTQLPALTAPVTITGPGADLLTVDANQQSRHFTVGAAVTAALSGLTLSNGKTGEDEPGGSIVNDGDLTLTALTLHNNTASSSGGAVFSNGTLVVSASTFSDNQAGFNGGGLFNGGNGQVTASTFSGNSVNNIGGGIFNRDVLAVTAVTLNGNTAFDGGGIRNTGTLTLGLTIVAGNTVLNGGIGPDIENTTGTLNDNGHNLIGDAASAGGLMHGVNGNLVGVDPLLGPLGDYGGPTPTMALLPGSPAIDAGDNSLAVDAMAMALAFDQRGAGFPRIVGDAVDIGAFEAQAAFSGSFDGPDGSALGDEFTVTSGRYSLMSGMAVAQGGRPAQATVEVSSADVAIDLDVSLAGNGSRAGVIARYTPKQGNRPESYYWGRLIKQNGQTFAEMLRYSNGVVKELGRVRVDLEGDEGHLRFEVFGSSLKLFVDFDLVLSATDNGLSGPGLTGIRAKKGAALDNLVVNNLTATQVALPFADDFSMGTANNTQLSLAWTNRVGNLALLQGLGARAVGNDDVSLATLNGLSTTSVGVQATVRLTDAVGDVGFVTNFTAGSKGFSYYWAYLARDGRGRFTANVVKVVNGDERPLPGGRVVLPGSFDGGVTHQLSFFVAGDSLQLVLDGQGLDTLTDPTPLAAGSAGLRATRGATFADFEAFDAL